MKIYLVIDLNSPEPDGAEAAIVGAYSTPEKAKRALMQVADGDIAVMTVDEETGK